MSTAVAERPNGAPATQQSKPQTVRQLLCSESMKSQFALALPKHCTAERFVRVALTALTKTPKLEQCTQASLFGCLLTLSQLGLEADGRRAHLIPYGDQCTLVLDYKGIVELAIRSGLVSNIHADKVCENDDFEYDRGQVTRHKIDFRKDDRGKPFAYYCIVRFKDGTEQAMVMSMSEIKTVQASSKAGRSGPWVTWFDEMAKKTVFKRLSKWITLSPEVREAIDVDDRNENVIETTAVPRLVVETSRSEQLANILSAAGEESQVADENAGEGSQVTEREPGDDPVEHETTGGLRLSDLALAIEGALHEPKITAAENTAQKQQIIEALTEKALTTEEATHLQRIVSENAERLAKKK